MPKSRTTHHASSTTSTTTILPTILHLNRHKRSGSTSSGSSGSSASQNSSASQSSAAGPGYGLLELSPTKRPSLQHRRKSSSSISSWSERAFDLSELRDKSIDIGGKIADNLPGVRYSASFLSTLRTNLTLSTEFAPPSPNLYASPPALPPISSKMSSFEQPHDSPDPLAQIPDLTFSPPTTEEEKVAGLKLVADIYSQHRSTVSRILIYNPLTALLLALLIALPYPLIRKEPTLDKIALGLTTLGMTMFILASIRHLVRGYQDLAESINWTWLGEDEMVIAKYGETVIGSCVYRISGPAKKKNLLIRAWTVRPRERGRGVGGGLLEKITEVAKQRGCGNVEFAPDEVRAGSERLLTSIDGFLGIVQINKGFDRDEDRGRLALERAWGERGGKRKGSR